MKCLDLLDRETIFLINEFENAILELIDNQEKFTRSDLQGAVEALVIKILNKGISLAQEK